MPTNSPVEMMIRQSCRPTLHRRPLTRPTPTNPSAFYSTCSVTDSVARKQSQLRRLDHEMWQSVLPDEDEDFDLVVAKLVRATGLSEFIIERSLQAHHRLYELPQLLKLQETLWHLDNARIRAIDDTLDIVDANNVEHMTVIDSQLSDFLTPTRPEQLLPTTGAIRRKLKNIIRLLDTTVCTDDPRPDLPDSVRIGIEGKRGFIEVTTDSISALEIKERTLAHAKLTGVTQAQALLDLVRGEATTSIILNIYQPKNIENAPVYVPGAGWTEDSSFADRAGVIRDLDPALTKTSNSYNTPDDIRSAVEGVDGTCRWPGCFKTATQCQMDHRIDHADGGPTTAANLASLCQRHHNIKTDGRVRYIKDPITGIITWLFEGGGWVVDEPDGPLSPKAKNWVQTMAQRSHNKRERARTEAQARKVDVPLVEEDIDCPF